MRVSKTDFQFRASHLLGSKPKKTGCWPRAFLFAHNSHRRLCFRFCVYFARLQLRPLLAFAFPVPKSEIHEERRKSTGEEKEPLGTALFSCHSPNGAHQDDFENKKSDENENTENVIQTRTSETGVSCRQSIRDRPSSIRDSDDSGRASNPDVIHPLLPGRPFLCKSKSREKHRIPGRAQESARSVLIKICRYATAPLGFWFLL